MLQRTEKSAYSWWWASHIRTKQSTWLENNLREMAETVHNMLKLMETDADSFAKRAELYFKRRPELVAFVEDAYRSYRALAERYDRISGELQKANHTIATSCPDQVQYAMLDEEDDEMFPKAFTPIDPCRINKRTVDGLMKKRRSGEEPARNKLQDKTIASQTDHEAKMQEEINKLQRGILVLESEKQFIKSSYESGIAKYWELEKQIMDLQEEIIHWRDDVSTAVIEENEARTIMIATTLKSCEDAMASIQQQRIESMQQVKVQSEIIRISKQKVKALKGDCCESKIECAEVSSGSGEKSFIAENLDKETDSLRKARLELKSICDKISEYIEITNPECSVQVAEEVNELLNMVVSLQLTVSSQAAQINRLTSNSNELETNLQKLQEEKMDSIEPTVLIEKVKEAEELLGKLEMIKKLVISEEANFCDNLNRVLQTINGISDKVSPSKPIEDDACTGHEFIEGEADSALSTEPSRECKDKEIMEVYDIKENSAEEILVTQPLVQFVQHFLQNETDSPLNDACVKLENPEETNTLGEKRSAVHQVEKKQEDYIREMVTLIGELVNVIAMRDEEIQRLMQQLASLKMRPGGSVIELDSEVLAEFKSEASSQRSSSVEGSNVDCVEKEEDKSTRNVDSLLGKNLQFWLRFSTTYRYIEQLKAKYAEIQSDISKLEDNKTQGGNDESADYQAAKPESEPVMKRLRELKGEVQVWSEHSMLLRGELQRRFLFLNNMKEEITSVVNTSSAAGEPLFSSQQAERLKGEVMDMKQETNKASSELLEGLDQVREVQAEIEQQLAQLYHNFELIVSKTKADASKAGVPLSVFLYGYTINSCKPKKPSLFARIRPIFQKQKKRASRR